MFGEEPGYWESLPPPPDSVGWREVVVAGDLSRFARFAAERPWQVEVRATGTETRGSRDVLSLLTAELAAHQGARSVLGFRVGETVRLISYARSVDRVGEIVREVSAARPSCLLEASAELDPGWASLFGLLSELQERWSGAPSAGVLSFDLPRSGARIGDRFIVEKVVRLDWRGAVYLAVDQRAGRRVELEAFAHAAGNVSLAGRIGARVEAVEQLSVEHVPRVISFGELPGGVPFVCREHLGGRTLAELMREGGIDAGEAVALFLDLAEALRALHRAGLSHEALSPETVLVRSARPRVALLGVDTPSLRWLDLLAARHVPPDAAHHLGAYRAPEQGLGQAGDARSDQYTAAVLFYELLTGAEPYGDAGSTVEAFRRKIRGMHTPLSFHLGHGVSRLEPVFECALHPQPDRRFPDIDRLARAVRACLGQTALDPSSDTAPGRPSMLPDPSTTSETLRTRAPRTLLVRDRAASWRIGDPLLREQVHKALRELVVAESESSEEDRASALERAAWLFLEALETLLRKRLAMWVADLRSNASELARFRRLMAGPWPRAKQHYALRLIALVASGGEASVHIMGRWANLEATDGAGEPARTVRGALCVPRERVDDLIAAGQLRNVLAHRSDYRDGRRRGLGRVRSYFRVTHRADGIHDLVLLPSAPEMLERLLRSLT